MFFVLKNNRELIDWLWGFGLRIHFWIWQLKVSRSAVDIPLVISEDSPVGNTSHSLAATKAQGLSHLSCNSSSANPNSTTGSSSVAVSQHSDKASSNLCSTGRSSILLARGRPLHDPLKKEDFTDTSDWIGLLKVHRAWLSDASTKPLSFCKMNSWHCTLGEGQRFSAIQLPGQISSLWAFEMPIGETRKWQISCVLMEILRNLRNWNLQLTKPTFPQKHS